MEEDINEVLKSAEQIGYIVGKYGTQKEKDLLRVLLADWQEVRVKNKEQEKHIKALDSVIVEHIEKNKEQEKMIELMNEYILKNCVSLEICSKQIGKECYIDVIYGDECKECVLEYFRKKAR